MRERLPLVLNACGGSLSAAEGSVHPCYLQSVPAVSCVTLSVVLLEAIVEREGGRLGTAPSNVRFCSTVTAEPGELEARPTVNDVTGRCQPSANTAPSGITPVSRYPHRATSSFLARATIPTFSSGRLLLRTSRGTTGSVHSPAGSVPIPRRSRPPSLGYRGSLPSE